MTLPSSSLMRAAARIGITRKGAHDGYAGVGKVSAGDGAVRATGGAVGGGGGSGRCGVPAAEREYWRVREGR